MRHTLVFAVVLALAVSSCASAQATEPPQSSAPPITRPQTPGTSADPTRPAAPRVKLLATGGTISIRNDGRLTAEELIRSIPYVTRYATPEFEQFANTGSSLLTLQQWLELARRINALYREDPALAGIVVSSGTDTLEELAFFLHLTVKDARPVAVVGSMRNASTLGYEGAANLLAGFRVAADPAAKGRGVLVVLNDEINSAREATKTDALRLHTFQTRGYGILGVIDADRVVYYRRIERRHTAESEFDPDTIKELPRVDVLMTYQGAPGDLIRAAVDAGAQGIVIATAGAGATSGTQDQGIEYARSRNVPVVSATRSGSGRIANGSSGREVNGEDFSPIKARILLMLALTKTKNPSELRRIFIEY